MNTIHSSSIAHYPVAYPKPQARRIDGGGASEGAGNGNPIGQGNEVNARPFNTEQIKAALADAGLINEQSGGLANNTRTQRALNAYTQNYNQTAQRRMAEIVSGIDIYA